MSFKVITDDFFKTKLESIPCTWGTPNGPIQIAKNGNADVIEFSSNVNYLNGGVYTLSDILPHSYVQSYGVACLMVANVCVGFATLITSGNILQLVTTGYGAPVTIQGSVMAIRQ